MSAASIRACLLASVLAAGAVLAACGGSEDTASPPFYLRARVLVEDGDDLHPGDGPVESRVEWWAAGPGRWRQDIGAWGAAAPDWVIHADGNAVVAWNREENTFTRTQFPAPVAPGASGTALRIGPAGEDDLDAFLASFREREPEAPTSVEVVAQDEVLGLAVVVVEVWPAYVSQTFGSGASGPMGEGSVRYWVDPESMFVLRQEIDSSPQRLVAEVVELELDPAFDPGLFDFEPPAGARDVTGVPPELSSGVETTGGG